jgi:hypothetical protein
VGVVAAREFFVNNGAHSWSDEDERLLRAPRSECGNDTMLSAVRSTRRFARRPPAVARPLANEGEGAITLTDVTSVKNQIAVSVSGAIPPDDKMPDKADCVDQSVSRLGLSVDAKDEGEGRTYMVPDRDVHRPRAGRVIWYQKFSARGVISLPGRRPKPHSIPCLSKIFFTFYHPPGRFSTLGYLDPLGGDITPPSPGAALESGGP